MITIRDVAIRAGVSPATVSRVLNGRGNVAAHVQQRVREAIAELGYRPSGIARSLRKQSTRVWGLMISDIQNPYFTALVRGVEDVAQAHGASLVLCNSDEELDKERKYFDVMVDERAAGVILSPTSRVDSDPSILVEHGIAVVVIDRQLDRNDFDTIVVANRKAALDSVAHLIEQGARRIGCIVGPHRITSSIERLNGYGDALSQAGIAFDPRLVRFANAKQDGGFTAATELLTNSPRPDALFVGNNLMTVGTLHALAELGLEVSRDVRLAAFDDMEWATLVKPSLTTVAQPTYDVGRLAGELLAERIAHAGAPPRFYALDATLIPRASSVITEN